MDIAQIRQEYMRARLDETSVARDPIVQFNAWFAETVEAKLPMVNAMTLATATREGAPSARIVLLKGVDTRGFVFYTSYSSRKAQELAVQPRAALLFYWIELEREVRIEGLIEKTSVEESDDYFATRPLGSQLAAIASPQSQVIQNRSVLEARYAELGQRYGTTPVRPADWGGYRVVPDAIEFWQGRPNRLHDRLLYRKQPDGAWNLLRLAP